MNYLKIFVLIFHLLLKTKSTRTGQSTSSGTNIKAALAKKIPWIISVGKTANKIYGESDSMLLKVACSNNKLDLICFADSFKDFMNYFFHSLWVLSLIAGKPFLRVGQCNIFMCTAEGLASIKFNKTFPIEQSCKGALTSISSPCCKVNRTLLSNIWKNMMSL